MNKIGLIAGSFILGMGLTSFCWAENPCKPIAEACKQAGYYKGGKNVGKGVLENCVMPIVAHTKTLANVTFTDDVLQQCSLKIKEKMTQN